jgi:hypothetical protein
MTMPADLLRHERGLRRQRIPESGIRFPENGGGMFTKEEHHVPKKDT